MALLKFALLRSILLGSLFSLTSCQFSYIVKSGYNQAQLLRSRKPIQEVVADPQTPEETKRKLKLAQEARSFAEKKLLLKATENYTTYVKLDRDAVSYVVSASLRYELKNYLWSFPLVGDLPYKGFFDRSEADLEAKKLETDGYDTHVRGVGAYSTLGWFKDPILSTMLSLEDHDLVNTIIHETVHATLYIKSQADFNERLATFLGDLGTELFYREREGENSQTNSLISLEAADARTFSKFISHEIETLKQWYATKDKKFTEEERRARIKEIQERFEKETLPQMKTKGYSNFSSVNLNNARLLGYGTYMKDLKDFELAFDKHGRDFKKFLEFCKSLEKAEDPAKELKILASSQGLKNK